MLRARSASELTAAVAAYATSALLAGQCPPGLAFAAEVLDPEATVAWLRTDPVLAAFELIEACDGIGETVASEEGAV